ncbi:MAG: hypothetical protein B7733_21345 [Myxococcales bacterium FL481]|nr:MAG: hypothetical protein B7733_21345 [Myxococcales bacterium FL481]
MRFWSGPFPRAAARDLTIKYTSLLQIAALEPGAGRARRLRRAATRWPGALREAELVGPRVCQERRDAIARVVAQAAPDALRRPSPPTLSRADWRRLGAGFAPLWYELHQMFADQLSWRAARRGEPSWALHDPLQSFVAWLPVAARERWGEASTLATLAGSTMSVGHAYARLALRSGLAETELRKQLFADLPRPEEARTLSAGEAEG